MTADSTDASPADSTGTATVLRVGQHGEHVLDVDGAATGLRVGQHNSAAAGLHVGYEYSEGCRATHRESRSDYDLGTRMISDLDKFDCEFFIPHVEKVQMDGNIIILPYHILEKLDELWKMKQDAKKDQ
ncbi:hypothetical protein C2845_PM05G10580 [Panicum miliaceum]|uniref:Uncharacterized protein n=1 Tax=Panicum miliaceum TaxID=4540 RepID=A0A3L6STU2_PANMI|nr:hypothetical protein C2845_PM05G10580 [Panicum miliaceum]